MPGTKHSHPERWPLVSHQTDEITNGSTIILGGLVWLLKVGSALSLCGCQVFMQKPSWCFPVSGPIWRSVSWCCCVKNSSSCKEQTVRNGDKQEESGRAVPSSRRWPRWSLCCLLWTWHGLSLPWPGFQQHKAQAKPRSMWYLAFLTQVVRLCGRNSTVTSVNTGRSNQATSCRNF